MNAPAREDPWDNDVQPDALIQKTAAVMKRVTELRAEIVELSAQLEAQRGAIDQLQAGHAAVRSALTEGAIAACAAHARYRAERRAALLEARRSAMPVGADWLSWATWRGRWGLVKMGAPGRTLLLAASGVWRWSGRPVYDLRHIGAYLRRGADRGVAPPSLFDQAFYLSRNPDVAARGFSPLLHYLATGQREGRDPHPLFDAAFYTRENLAALRASRLWPLAHFMRHGARAGRDPHPLFDTVHYLSQNPMLATGEDAPSHYVREGWRLGLSPHPLFDPAWYQAQMPASAADTPPLVHFILEGAAAGLSPHALFDPAWYLAQAPEAGPNPLAHYLAFGAGRGHSPSPCFDPQHYVARRGAAPPAGVDPLVDYLQGGAWSVAEPAPGFATAAYIAAHPDLLRTGVTPLEHWARRTAEQRLRD